MTMRLPDLVIAGAPKCGTSSLFSWLADHPEVCPSPTKETYYLMDRDSLMFNPAANVHEHGIAGYARLFADCPAGAKVCMEATPDYLYQHTAPQVLAQMSPPPLAFFCLRKPSERVFSAYRFYQGNLSVLDDGASFTSYVARLRAGAAFPGRLGPLVAAALDQSLYARHCLRWAAALGKERLRFVLFEDLRRDPGQVLDRLCLELGLDRSFYRDYAFPAHNPSIRVRSQALHRLRNQAVRFLPPGRYRCLTSLVYRFFNYQRRGLAHSQEDQATLRELDAYFAADSSRLAAEFGLDLSAWDLACPGAGRPVSDGGGR